MNLSDVDLNLLKVFEALYIEKNVTKAAHKLGVAQSSLSSSLKRLRKLFQDELFIRSADGMLPTKRAVTVESDISECLDSVRRAMREPIQFCPSTSTKLFTIGGSDFTAFTILPSLIKYLGEHAPHVRLEMKPILPGETVDQIERGSVDFAICAGSFNPKKLFHLPLFEEDMQVITSKKNSLLGKDKKLTSKKYAQLQHIYIASKGEGEKIVDRALKKLKLKRDIYLTVQNFLIVPFIVENSDLVATVSRRVAYQCSQRSKLNIHPFPTKIEKNKFNILWGKTTNNDPEIQWLIQAISHFFDFNEKPQS